jgi:hypothetical protein
MHGHDVFIRLRLLNIKTSGKNQSPTFRQTDVKIIAEESMEVKNHEKRERHFIMEKEKIIFSMFPYYFIRHRLHR